MPLALIQIVAFSMSSSWKSFAVGHCNKCLLLSKSAAVSVIKALEKGLNNRSLFIIALNAEL
jgi:hypothetical protein